MAWKNTRGMATQTRKTITIDATGKVVGRLATSIAKMLLGKDQPGYTPHIDSGAVVNVTNADKLVYTGKKMQQKVLFRSSNRPGGITRLPVAKLQAEKPGKCSCMRLNTCYPKTVRKKPV